MILGQLKQNVRNLVKTALLANVAGILLGSAVPVFADTPSSSPLSVVLSGDISRSEMVQQVLQYLYGMREKQLEADAAQRFSSLAGSAQTTTNANNITNGAISPSLIQAKMLQASNYALYQEGSNGAPLSNGSLNPYMQATVNHFLDFCTKSSNTEASQYCNVTDPSTQHADIQVSSLIGSNGYGTTSNANAEAFITNVTSPYPDNSVRNIINKGIQNAGNADYQTIGQALNAEALTSIARNSLYTMYANRLSVDGNTPSMMQTFQSEATRRFPNTTWLESVATGSSEALLRELAQMEAFKVWLEYQRYLQMERVEALLSAQLTSLVNGAQTMNKQVAQGQAVTNSFSGTGS